MEIDQEPPQPVISGHLLIKGLQVYVIPTAAPTAIINIDLYCLASGLQIGDGTTGHMGLS